jgi:hypothetical protein
MTPRNEDDDRPTKSWREIDKMRDSSQRRERRSQDGPSRQQRSSEYRSYKTQLNKLFDGGALPAALKDKLDDGFMDEARERKQAQGEILAAGSSADVLGALARYREAHGFPADEEVLAKLLDLDDEGVLMEAIQTIDRLHGEGGLTRSSSLKARLKTVQTMIDEPEIQEAAQALLRKL